MKKSIASFFFSLALGNLLAQVQTGLVREQNSNKTPLANVQVIFSDALPSSSDQSGRFRLAFSGKKPGDLIFFQEITKKDYEIVNQKELHVLKIGSNTNLGKDIILTKVGQLDAAKKEYYGISDKALQASFNKEKIALQERLKNVQLTQQEYLGKFNALSEQYEQQQKDLDALADVFARTNFDDVSEEYKQAFELFKVGKINEALKILEGTNLLSRTEKRLKEKKRIEAAAIKIAEQKEQNEKEIQEDLQGLQLQAQLYVLTFQVEKAEGLYDQVLRLDSTDLTILQDVADFYRENHRYDKAIHLLNSIIVHPLAQDWLKANAHGEIGDMYTAIGQVGPATQAYLVCQKIYSDLLSENPKSLYWKNGFAVSLEKLGDINISLGDLDKALSFFLEERNLYIELCKSYPISEEFKNGLSFSYERLGETYTSLGHLDKALAFFEDFSKVMEDLYVSYSQNVNFKIRLAISYSKLGETQTALGRLNKALIFFEKNNELSKELYYSYPKNVICKETLACSYDNLGEINRALGNLDNSLTFFEGFTRLMKELYESYPKNVKFKNGLAISYEKLGSTNIALGNLDKALTYFDERSRLGNELCESFPQHVDFKHGLAIGYKKLGSTYSALGNLDKALSYFEKGLILSKDLYESYPQNIDFKNNLAISYSKLGDVYTALGHFDKSLIYFKQYIRFEKELYESNIQNVDFKNGLAISYEKLGSTYYALGNLNESLTFFQLYYQLEKDLYELNPQNVDFQHGLAISYSKLGDIHTELGNSGKALTLFEDGIKLFEDLYRSSPQNLDFKHGLAISYSRLGNVNISLGYLDKGLVFLERYNQLERELYHLYPKNVEFKYNLAISNVRLASFYLERDFHKGKKYLQEAESHFVALNLDSPQNAQFKQSLDIVRKVLSTLSQPKDVVAQLKSRIQNETDSLVQYALYTILCDTLRQRAKTDPQQKPALANALNSRAWLGFFLAPRSVGVTSGHPNTWSAIEADVREGMALDPDNKFLPSNLAPALLFQGKKDTAMAEYKKWMDKPFNEDYPTYREAFLDDLNTFEKAGIIPEARRGDVAAVRKLLATK